MAPTCSIMQIDTFSVKGVALNFALLFGGLLTYQLLLRKERLSKQHLMNELAALWLSSDAAIHAVVLAVDTARMLALPEEPGRKIGITLVWEYLARPSATFNPVDTVAQTAVTLALPVAGYAALKWWREGTRWREGEMVVAAMDIYAVVAGFMQFRPERLRDMSYERRQAALQVWCEFFFLNMLWIIVPAALLWYNYQALCMDNGNEQERETMAPSETPFVSEKSAPAPLNEKY